MAKASFKVMPVNRRNLISGSYWAIFSNSPASVLFGTTSLFGAPSIARLLRLNEQGFRHQNKVVYRHDLRRAHAEQRVARQRGKGQAFLIPELDRIVVFPVHPQVNQGEDDVPVIDAELLPIVDENFILRTSVGKTVVGGGKGGFPEDQTARAVDRE